MARNTWQIEKKNGTWANDGTIYRPNTDTDIGAVSTQIKLKLADGDQGFIMPSTKYIKNPISFEWLNIEESDSFRAKIEAYITNGDYLRITTHLSETFTGRFISVKRVWISGIEDAYDLEANFEIMSN